MKNYSLLLSLLLLAGCASSNLKLPASVNQHTPLTSNSDFLLEDTPTEKPSAQTEIRPGNLIKLTSNIDPKLTTKARVNFDGSIQLPYGVSLNTDGLNLGALTKKIQDRYKTYFKVQPDIQIQIAESKYFIDVRGLIQKPGLILVDERERIEDVIKKAGNLTADNDVRLIQIIRGNNTYYVDLGEYFQGRNIERSPKWFGGEKVSFLKSSSFLGSEDSQVVEVLGDVRNPGGLTYNSQADLYHYIFKAGGTTPSSDWDRIQIMRMTPKGRAVAWGPAQDLAKSVQLEPGDTIVVGSSTNGQFERNIQVGSLIGTILSAIGILVIAL